MNNKGNIFEELNKMKGLIHAKAGTVISEQLIYNQTLDSSKGFGNVAAQTANQLSGRLTANQMLVTSKGFGNVTPEMADQLVKSGKINSSSIILPAQRTAMKDEAQKELDKGKVDDSQRKEHIKLIYCSVKDGIITSPLSELKGKPWEKYRTDNKVTGLEIADAAKACTENTGYKFGDDLSKTLNIQGKDDTQKGGTNTVNTRFVKSATDLGVQSGKMDLQTLQSILAKLQDDGSQSTVTQDTSTTTQPAGTTTQQTPDLTQLTSLLNQLNA
jgi:hypothetical protein